MVGRAPLPALLYLHGLCEEMAEAFAKHFHVHIHRRIHGRIHGELRFAAEEVRDPAAMAVQGYRGSRHPFGYPPAPTSPTKEPLTLSNAEEVGITLSE